MSGKNRESLGSCSRSIRHALCSGLILMAAPVLCQPALGQSAVRNVSPPGVAVPQVTAPLHRVEPIRPQAARQAEAAAVPERSFHIIRPLALESAKLKSGKLTLELAHVAGLSAGETCETASGQTWPCGARALTALRSLLRSHRVDCEPVQVEAQTPGSPMPATCRKGPVDLGLWLVQQGWARAAGDAPEAYSAAEAAARQAHLGQWQADDFEPLPQTSALPVLPLETLPGLAGGSELQTTTPMLPQVPAAPSGPTPPSAQAPVVPAWENPFDVPDEAAEQLPSSAAPPPVQSSLLPPP
jgi:endonuclease YncB( thermonuclease family)